jgi:phage shock protein PspC (stress-responsive transcriptional regulator)
METTHRLARSDIDRIVGGVCGGIANYIGADPLIVRLVFVILSWAFGLSWWLYLLLWAVIPSASSYHASDMMTGEVQTPADTKDVTV